MKKRAVWDLFLISALGLFSELVFLRWVSSELRMFAFYKNFALIGAFLGFGLGFAIKDRYPKKWVEGALPYLWFSSVSIIFLLGRTSISDFVLANQSNAQEFIWAGYVGDAAAIAIFNVVFYVLLFLVFSLVALVFIPIGRLTASRFEPFQPLRGYTINVLGSLTGILLYTLISYLRWPPFLWFGISAIGLMYFVLPYVPSPRKSLAAVLLLASVGITLIPMPGVERTFWSPYYRIDLTSLYGEQDPDVFLGYELSVNQAWHQRLMNLDESFVAENYAADPVHFDIYTAGYDAPLTAVDDLENVLVVGAGAGNDVASLLRVGAEQITAVEIDPVILDIGRELHPENPYRGLPNVELVVQDARTFFRSDQGQYDLILFGRLDSHTLFSAASSVRLDNFVYTVESLQDVRRLLAEDGTLILSFGIPPENEWIGYRLYRLLVDVFGHAPQVYQLPESVMTFIIGKEPFEERLIDDPRLIFRDDFTYDSSIEPTTDAWPFLYLRERRIPSVYLIGLLGVALISFVLIRRLLPDFKSFSPHFFFMGTAFFLLETRGITEIALLLGSTWVVNAAVIGAILLMIVLANLLVEYYRIDKVFPYYLALGATLLFNFFVPISAYLDLPLVGRVLVSSFTVALPLFFAGIIFAVTFKRAASIEGALGSNLVGAVLGGVFEYTSLVLGIRWLYILAFVFYALSGAAWFSKKR